MTIDNSLKIGGLLLAAGGSSRLGHTKQLVQFEGKTLIRRSTETLVNSKCDPIVVVLGAEIERSAAEIADLPVSICINDRWTAGMSSSICIGLSTLIEMEPDLDSVVIMLCDQPHLTADNLNQLIAKFTATRSAIVSARYNAINGVPAIFSKELFKNLLQLQGDKGARHLIRDRNDVVTIEIEKAAFDVDCQLDLDNEISRQ